ncbi:MAG: RnfABCDGE type electron transport complex subunit C [Clostridia bacterium]|nr:RnfABCDGE type electron transport complex subunit C [Clostridia bacterium]
MSNLNSFIGGIRIQKNAIETVALGMPIEKLPPPGFVCIQFSKPALPAVAVGDRVFLGSPLTAPGAKRTEHSSVSGKVSGIELDADGNAISVTIENDKLDELAHSVTPFNKKLTETSPEEILSIIKNAGICESNDGISVARRIECALGGTRRLIVNCTQCEPFLASRNRLVLERPSDVLNGAKILLRALEVSFADIAIDNSDISAIRVLEDVIGDNPLLRLRVTGDKYPQGNKALIVNAVTGKEPPARETTSQLGYVVFTAETCAAIFRAFAQGMPQTRRIVTVGGDCINEQKVLEVPIGTPLSDIVSYCGSYTAKPAAIISGGLMKGTRLSDDSYFISKRDVAFLFLSDAYIKPIEATDCIRCGKCVDDCPMHLMPNYLVRHASVLDLKKSLAMGLRSCIECGICAYNCPSGINHVYHIRRAKEAYNAEKAKEESDE